LAPEQAQNSTNNNSPVSWEQNQSQGNYSLPGNYTHLSFSYSPGETVKNLVSFNGVKRFYCLHVPASYKPTSPTPIVFVFHGSGGTAYGTERSSGFTPVAEENGFIAIYPQGLGTSRAEMGQPKIITILPSIPTREPSGWNSGSSESYSSMHNLDDLGFIMEILEKSKSELNVDERKVYSTGLSNGGGMTKTLGLLMPQVFAALAPVSAGIGLSIDYS